MASSGMQVLREVHSIKSRISHHLLSGVQMASFPKGPSSEIPVNWVWWVVSISPQPQRVTSECLSGTLLAITSTPQR